MATLTVEGAVEPLCFDAHCEPVRGSRLRRGDVVVVVLDKLGAHRARRIEEVAERRGAQAWWLAPYSPDFSPIEQCWSKLRSYLGGAKARTGDELDKVMAQASKLVSRQPTAAAGSNTAATHSHASENRYKPNTIEPDASIACFHDAFFCVCCVLLAWRGLIRALDGASAQRPIN